MEWIKKIFFKKPKTRKEIIEARYRKLFSKRVVKIEPYLKIGAFQLENLMENPIKFILLDLRDKNEAPYFKKSIMATAETAEGILKENHITLDDAVVIVCRDGNLSESLAQTLSLKKYKNIVILNGGTQSLEN